LAGSNALRLSAAALVALVLLVVALGWIETRRHREGALLGNLGISPLVLSVFLGAPAVLGELLLGTGAALLP
jgi:hypothetical protein